MRYNRKTFWRKRNCNYVPHCIPGKHLVIFPHEICLINLLYSVTSSKKFPFLSLLPGELGSGQTKDCRRLSCEGHTGCMLASFVKKPSQSQKKNSSRVSCWSTSFWKKPIASVQRKGRFSSPSGAFRNRNGRKLPNFGVWWPDFRVENFVCFSFAQYGAPLNKTEVYKCSD